MKSILISLLISLTAGQDQTDQELPTQVKSQFIPQNNCPAAIENVAGQDELTKQTANKPDACVNQLLATSNPQGKFCVQGKPTSGVIFKWPTNKEQKKFSQSVDITKAPSVKCSTIIISSLKGDNCQDGTELAKVDGQKDEVAKLYLPEDISKIMIQAEGCNPQYDDKTFTVSLVVQPSEDSTFKADTGGAVLKDFRMLAPEDIKGECAVPKATVNEIVTSPKCAQYSLYSPLYVSQSEIPLVQCGDKSKKDKCVQFGPQNILDVGFEDFVIDELRFKGLKSDCADLNLVPLSPVVNRTTNIPTDGQVAFPKDKDGSYKAANKPDLPTAFALKSSCDLGDSVTIAISSKTAVKKVFGAKMVGAKECEEKTCPISDAADLNAFKNICKLEDEKAALKSCSIVFTEASISPMKDCKDPSLKQGKYSLDDLSTLQSYDGEARIEIQNIPSECEISISAESTSCADVNRGNNKTEPFDPKGVVFFKKDEHLVLVSHMKGDNKTCAIETPRVITKFTGTDQVLAAKPPEFVFKTYSAGSTKSESGLADLLQSLPDLAKNGGEVTAEFKSEAGISPSACGSEKKKAYIEVGSENLIEPEFPSFTIKNLEFEATKCKSLGLISFTASTDPADPCPKPAAPSSLRSLAEKAQTEKSVVVNVAENKGEVKDDFPIGTGFILDFSGDKTAECTTVPKIKSLSISQKFGPEGEKPTTPPNNGGGTPAPSKSGVDRILANSLIMTVLCTFLLS